ncbi:hypothetical protein JZK55_17630 [Dissulfurispira thermophila]|uniref:Uncharacterized protein n=1 Tax=Dissulfurispira thermophila TaxID=2715679 RepID=A0A7G1H3W8_9BACT|nr:zinc ribbon domain-containing protein [Dissulfurispira thermophila]BCB96841.1 hypothetical protein JZK55_17630 [Dissulfurispira thermophila]
MRDKDYEFRETHKTAKIGGEYMAVEYICFSCGNHFAISQSAMHNAEDNNCPKCGSANVLKLNPHSLYGLFGGGG